MAPKVPIAVESCAENEIHEPSRPIPPVDFLIRHFSILLIAGVLVNAYAAHRRIPALVAARGGTESGDDARRFVWGAAALFSVYFILINYVVLTSGVDDLQCFVPQLHPRNSFEYEKVVLWFGWIVGVTLWVWFGNGASVIARNAPLLERSFRPGKQYTAKGVRIFVLVWCVGTIAAPLVAFGQRPTSLSCASTNDAPGAAAKSP